MTQRVFTRCLEIADALLGRGSVRTIVEVGARDCTETRAFEAAFPGAKVEIWHLDLHDPLRPGQPQRC